MILGNTIKNYQKKQRKERKEALKMVTNLVHNKMIDRLAPTLNEFKESEREIYNTLYK